MILSPNDITGLTLLGEAEGEPVEGKIGVGNAIRTRFLRHYRGLRTYEEVCLAPGAFSCWSPAGGKDNYLKIKRIRDQILHNEPVRQTPAIRECWAIARDIMAGDFQDNVHGAMHYYAIGSPEPFWAKGETPVCTRGHHLFYAGIT